MTFIHHQSNELLHLFVQTDFLHVLQQHLFIMQKNRDVLSKLPFSFIKRDSICG